MKRFFILISISVMFWSCSSGPEKAAREFTENLAQGKIEEAKKFATEPTGKLLDFAAGFGETEITPNFKFVMVKDSVVENKAWVTYIDKDGKEEVLELVKLDGHWKVHIQNKK